MILCFICFNSSMFNASIAQCFTPQCLIVSIDYFLNGSMPQRLKSSTDQRLNLSMSQWLNGSTAQRLNGSTAQRLKPINGSTSQRLKGSTSQRLNASFFKCKCLNASMTQQTYSQLLDFSTGKWLNGSKLQNFNTSSLDTLTIQHFIT